MGDAYGVRHQLSRHGRKKRRQAALPQSKAVAGAAALHERAGR